MLLSVGGCAYGSVSKRIIYIQAAYFRLRPWYSISSPCNIETFMNSDFIAPTLHAPLLLLWKTCETQSEKHHISAQYNNKVLTSRHWNRIFSYHTSIQANVFFLDVNSVASVSLTSRVGGIGTAFMRRRSIYIVIEIGVGWQINMKRKGEARWTEQTLAHLWSEEKDPSEEKVGSHAIDFVFGNYYHCFDYVGYG